MDKLNFEVMKLIEITFKKNIESSPSVMKTFEEYNRSSEAGKGVFIDLEA
jgi:hypothetical protein